MNDLTIVLVTRNRPRMAQQTLDAYLRFMPRENILVADGTGTDESPWARMERVSREVRTPFAVLASDDDLLLEEGLRASVVFLRQHGDYSACHGVHYGARLLKEKLTLRTIFRPLPNDSDNPTTRILFFLTRPFSLSYSMRRTEVMRHGMAVLPGFDRFNFNEVVLNVRTVVAGKVGGLDIPYMIRNDERSLSAPDDPDEVFINYVPPTLSWLDDPVEFLARQAAFRRTMAPYIADERLLNIAYVIWWQRHFETPTIFKYLAREGICDERECEMLQEALRIGNDGDVPDLTGDLAPLRANGWPAYID